ncbi:MAG: PH domain-containing protein [Candidatus ainarchaeum sp.]|nr:PH domain-containing protein [Candidatus ainarchaeum sp.]
MEGRKAIVLRQHFAVAYLLILVGTLVLLAASTYLTYEGGLNQSLQLIVPACIIILALTASIALFIRHQATYYTLTEREVMATEGIITKSVRSVPYEKIDNITQIRSLADRILQTGSLEIDTPGHEEPEILMRYLPFHTIDDIAQMCKCRMEGKESMDAETKLSCYRAEADVASVAGESPAREVRPKRESRPPPYEPRSFGLEGEEDEEDEEKPARRARPAKPARKGARR